MPSWGNDFVGMVKDTSLVGVIGIFELYRTGQKLVSDTFLPFEVWTGIAVMYIAIVFLIDGLVRLDRTTPASGDAGRGLLARPAQRRDRRPRSPGVATRPSRSPHSISTHPTTPDPTTA